jgi:hypothetical protein
MLTTLQTLSTAQPGLRASRRAEDRAIRTFGAAPSVIMLWSDRVIQTFGVPPSVITLWSDRVIQTSGVPPSVITLWPVAADRGRI